MKTIRIIILYFFFLSSFSLIAQEEEPFYFNSLTIEDNLSQSTIYKILQDSHGFMWFGTEVGTDKYDGSEFLKIDGYKNHLSDRITVLFENTYAKDEYVLVGTEDVLYTISCDKNERDSIKNSKKKIIYASNIGETDSLILFSKDSSYIFSNSTVIPLHGFLKEGFQISSVVKLPDLNFILGTNKGVYKYSVRDTTLTNLTNNGIRSEEISLIHRGRSDSLFTCIQEEGKTLLSVISISGNFPSQIIPIPSINITALFLDESKRLWIGTKASGIYLYHTLAKKLIKVKSKSSVKINQRGILSITQSRDGVIWFGTNGGGIYMLQEKKQNFQHIYRPTDSYNNHVWSIYTDKNIVLAGTRKDGIAVHNLTTNSTSNLKIKSSNNDNTANEVFKIIRKADNEIFIGTGNGLFEFDFSKLETDSKYKPVNYKNVNNEQDRIPFLYHDEEKNQLWVHSRTDDNKSLVILKTDENFKTSDNRFIKYLQDVRIDFVKKYYNEIIGRNEYWIGTDKGLKIISENSSDVKTSIDSIDIFAMYHHGDTIKIGSRIWIGTIKKGLIQIDPFGQEVKTYYKDYGFYEDVIYNILQDSFNNLWFSTNHGLYKFDIETEIFDCYRVKDGVQSDEFNSGAMYRNDANFYFGGINGVTLFQPKDSSTKNKDQKKSEFALKYKLPDSGKKNRYLFPSSQNTTLYLPREFKNIKLEPLIFNYQNSSNNQFQFQLFNKFNDNNKGWQIKKKGEPIEFNTGNLRTMLGGDSSYLKIKIRENNSGWQELEPLPIYVGWHSGEIEAILLLTFLTFLGIVGIGVLIKRRQTKSETLNRIHKKINETSRLESIDEICITALNHFINEFKVDYVIISLIDFNERKLKVRYAKDKLSEAKVETNETTYFEKIDGEGFKKSHYYSCLKSLKTCDISSSKNKISDLHTIFFNKEFNKGKKRNGFLFALTHRSKEQEKSIMGDTALGVIEVGFDNYHKIPWNTQIINIELYIDNLAQPFYRALIEDKEVELIEEVLEPKDVKKAIDPSFFLQNAIDRLMSTIGVDYGGIALKTFNFENINLIEKENLLRGYSLKNIPIELKKKLETGEKEEGVCRYVLQSGKPFYSNSINKDKEHNYLELASDIKSEMVIPLALNNIGNVSRKLRPEQILGVLTLSSKQADYFNKVQLLSIDKLTNRISDIYYKKKLYTGLSDLSEPYNIFSKDITPIYDQIISSLSKYFDSNSISIWEKTNEFEKEKVTFELARTSNDKFQKEYDKLKHDKIKIIRRKKYLGEETFNIEQVSNLKRIKNIYKLCDANNFKSYIILRVAIENDYEIFINVFSRRILNNSLRNEDKIFIRQITRKAKMAIQSAKMVETFKSISKSFLIDKRTDTLETIVNNAVEVLHADLVSLFYFEDSKKLKIKESVFSNSYPHRFRQKKSKFANVILNVGTQWIENLEDYLSILNSQNVSQKYEEKSSIFWEDAALKSVAAIRLKFENRVLGVMFFNYKNQKDFSKPEAKRFIQGFADWATVAIINADNLDDIRENIQQLQAESKSLEEQTKNFRNKFEKVQADMEEIIPQTARTSFYLIIEGMNHDIRNSLLKLKQTTINIKNQGDRLREKERISINARIKDIDYNIKLISNLLDLYDFKKIKKEVININENLKAVVFNFKQRNDKIKFDLSGLDKSISDLFCYKVELSMVFYNIINNAISAIEEKEKGGGIIKISTEFKKDSYYIKIEDDGTGISNEKIETIFEPGYTTKKEGVGIGLFFVREILKSNFYATIKCNSKKGKGTTFTIEIPEFINQID